MDENAMEAARGGENGVGCKGNGRRRARQNGDTVVARTVKGVVGPEKGVGGNVKGGASLEDPKFNLCLGAGKVTWTRTAHPGFLEADDVEGGSMPSQHECGHNIGGGQARGVVGCNAEGKGRSACGGRAT